MLKEAHLGLGRVHVDVDALRVHGQEQHRHRVTPGRQELAVGQDHRLDQRTVLDRAPVHEQQQPLAVRAVHRGRRDVAVQTAVTFVLVHLQQTLVEAVAVQRAYAFILALAGRHVEGLALAVRQRKADLGVGGRDGLQQLDHVAELGGVALQPAAPRGHVEEQVADFDHRAGGPRGLADFAGLAAGTLELQRHGRVAGAGGDARAADALDAGQRLAAEAVGQHPEQLLDTAELAGGVGLEGQLQVFGVHADAVVGHADQGLAGVHQLHVHAGGAGVQGVFHQFLDHAGRAFHHLAGGDLVGELGRQQLDAGHGAIVGAGATSATRVEGMLAGVEKGLLRDFCLDRIWNILIGQWLVLI
ncbi:MAG: hypothetical protein M5U25_13635 [Planctomycetota bacterium]|nr:hypothetical protein [Planctomycetota bacterium]